MAQDASELNRTTKSNWTPNIVRPGQGTKVLSRFLWDGKWTGTVEADGMGPRSPEMWKAKGERRVHESLMTSGFLAISNRTSM